MHLVLYVTSDMGSQALIPQAWKAGLCVAEHHHTTTYVPLPTMSVGHL